ncbi:hypothetical protein [Idiomarina xiamenensis]|uniref:ASP external chaperone domain-containing protein n=1 Tax=Idiomarina xiamenensis 10-D-4 TaxID=740709 RepID=K2JU96_9GAMM|nr:hypothetical protein [Idiomarina xiamenensis]EKE87011.1 hypothetical protein A10D4_02177 [Idiomarina xiamenensis 10-D-4]
MKFTKVMSLAAVAALSVNMANAQQSIDKKQLDHKQVVAEAKKLPQGVAKQRVYKNYRLANGVAKNDALTSGARVFNEVTRELGTVSGNVTVLTNDGVNVGKIAQQFGLSVVNQESRVGLAVLSAPANTDLTALVEQLKSSDLVKSARIEIVEALNQPR